MLTAPAATSPSAQGQTYDPAAKTYQEAQSSRRMPLSTVPQTSRLPFNSFASPSTQPSGQILGFAAPPVNGTQASTSAQYVALAQLIDRTEPQVVRQVFNTVVHRAQPSTLVRVITDFGSRLIGTSKRQIISHFKAGDFDEVASEILGKASTHFLDLALAQRLETIRARPLVNALAKAERLGYNEKDVVEERKDGTEIVISYVKQHLAQDPPQYRQPSVQPLVQPSVQKTKSPLAMPASTRQQSQAMETSQDRHDSSNFLQCQVCSRPVSGTDALNYHQSKGACRGEVKTIDQVGKSLCPHCGCFFNSSGGLPYHLKSNVCGMYTGEHASAIMPALEKFYREHVPARGPGSTHRSQSMPSSAKDESRSRSAQLPSQGARFTSMNPNPGTPATPTLPAASSGGGKHSDPYAHLSPEDKKELEMELARTEAHYGNLLRKAMLLPQPEQDEEVSKIKNCFNTKQSTTRKKYGVKLRERRTKAEIEAERERLFKAPPEETLGQPQEAPASQDGAVPVIKKARVNERGDSAPAAQPVISGPGADSPRRRVRLADMGGLGASAATAEHTDPTTTKQSYSASQPPSTNGSANVAGAISDARAGEARNDPMELDEVSSATEDSDSEEEDDDDIPAVLTT
ncbi:uncharacterized protein MAM_01841 [Metarhizium album ARSEF 1941]|uniref:Uncharacterized protein n=1 Tax=Metarhizium album (strain ARSEF 1941) TaxID=1081103 RepID=A0A0B2X2F4_METAS|nr:uncharacterized protein MAM_01841 [Metarhizium album ARSEF 1941]KHN99917.1 hypothetical protein MAM_01841 [Metarhizium album ARSEF 1941]